MRQVKKEKNKTVLIIVASILLVIAMVGGTFYYNWNNSQKSDRAALETGKNFTKALEKQDFKKLSQLVTSESLKKVDYTKESLVDKYTVIFDGINASKLKISDLSVTPIENKSEFKLTYTLNMQTKNMKQF